MIKHYAIAVFVFCFLTLAPGLQLAVTQAEPVVLKAYSAFPQTDHSNKPYLDFIAAISERSKGGIKIDFVRGPEAIPPFQALSPLSKGVIDLAFMPGAYFAGQVPEAMVDLFVQGQEDKIFRKTGVEAFLKQVLLKKANVHSLGWMWMGEPFMLLGNTKLERADFSGLKVRSISLTNPWVKSLGGTPVRVPGGERYITLQKGLVDLAMAPVSSIANERLYEVSKYLIFPSFFEVRDYVLVNADTWKKVPSELQTMVQDAAREYEKKARQFAQGKAAEAEKLLLEKLERVDLPPEEAKKFLNTLNEVAWAFVIERTPENGQRLKKMLSQ